MKFRFLGTGDGKCKVKRQSSKDFRRRPALLIDERLLIDPTSDIFDFAEFFSYDDLYDAVDSVLITHSHPSHLDPATLRALAEGKTLHVYATEAVLKKISDIPEIVGHALKPMVMYDVADYRIIALPAPHEADEDEVALQFVICRDKTLLYALDGGGIHYDAWWLLKRLHIDVAVLDCALGIAEPSANILEHGSLASATVCREILASAGVLGDQSRVILSHLPSDKTRSIHDELSAEASALGMSVAYDGFFLTV